MNARAVFHWFVIACLVATGFWVLTILGQLYRRQSAALMCIWLFVPVIAVWLATQRTRSMISLSSLRLLRRILVSAAICGSLLMLFGYGTIRDYLGRNLVEGYHVTYDDDTDDYGRPIKTDSVSTAHWYSRFGLWVFEWLALGFLIGVPIATSIATDRAVDLKERERSED